MKYRDLQKVSRTLHIYTTLAALLMILFFSASGFILNHEDWFSSDSVNRRVDAVNIPEDVYKQGDRLTIVEYLRNQQGTHGQVSRFDQDDEEIRVVFTAPGSHTEAVIARTDGKAEITRESQGLAAILMDLHQAKGTGGTWKLVLDISVALLFLGSVTGLIIFFASPKRRVAGLITLGAGSAACLAIYFLIIP